MTAKPKIPVEAYRAAALRRNEVWGYDKSLEPDHFERVVEGAMGEAGLRADVEAVWPLAYAAGQADVKAMRARLAGELEQYADRTCLPGGESLRMLYRAAALLRRGGLVSG